MPNLNCLLEIHLVKCGYVTDSKKCGVEKENMRLNIRKSVRIDHIQEVLDRRWQRPNEVEI